MVVPTLFSDFRLAPFIFWLQNYNKNCTYANNFALLMKNICTIHFIFVILQRICFYSVIISLHYRNKTCIYDLSIVL
jgi:hypothetical protein